MLKAHFFKVFGNEFVAENFNSGKIVGAWQLYKIDDIFWIDYPNQVVCTQFFQTRHQVQLAYIKKFVRCIHRDLEDN